VISSQGLRKSCTIVNSVCQLLKERRKRKEKEM
jgi:hypothetical protein